MLGMTAYGGTVLQLAPKPGETIVVSAVSGGVGQCSAQMPAYGFFGLVFLIFSDSVLFCSLLL